MRLHQAAATRLAQKLGYKGYPQLRSALQKEMMEIRPRVGPGFEPFAVAGDYAARRTIEDSPDALPFEELNFWQIDPAKTATARSQILDLVIMLQ